MHKGARPRREPGLGGISTYADVAYGAGWSFTYTLMNGGADMAAVTTITDGAFEAIPAGTGGVAVVKWDWLRLKVSASAGAATATHRGFVHLIPVGS